MVPKKHYYYNITRAYNIRLDIHTFKSIAQGNEDLNIYINSDSVLLLLFSAFFCFFENFAMTQHETE